MCGHAVSCPTVTLPPPGQHAQGCRPILLVSQREDAGVQAPGWLPLGLQAQ